MNVDGRVSCSETPSLFARRRIGKCSNAAARDLSWHALATGALPTCRLRFASRSVCMSHCRGTVLRGHVPPKKIPTSVDDTRVVYGATSSQNFVQCRINTQARSMGSRRSHSIHDIRNREYFRLGDNLPFCQSVRITTSIQPFMMLQDDLPER